MSVKLSIRHTAAGIALVLSAAFCSDANAAPIHSVSHRATWGIGSALSVVDAIASKPAPPKPTTSSAVPNPSPTRAPALSTSSVAPPSSIAAPTPSAGTQTARPNVLVGTYPGSNFPTDIDSYTSAVGLSPDIVEWFQSWDEPLYYSSQRTGVDARNVTPLITWSPGSNFSPARLAAGGYDSYLIAQAQAARAWNRPLMIRPFHEMNGTWNSYGYTKETPQQFVAGWRHVIDVFRVQGVTNVSWVWSPNIYGFGGSTPFDAYYPGDAYVNWTGLDGYNFPGTWRSFSTLYSASYADVTKLTTKPLMVAEWGCSSTGGDKAAWILDAFAQLTTTMPRVKAMVSFDRVRESDFRINSSAAVLAAYRTALGLLKG